MNYFEYCGSEYNLDFAFLSEVETVLFSDKMKSYSKAKNGHEDYLLALVDAYHHIVNHFKREEDTNLEHYAYSIVKTIRKNKYKSEAPDEYAVEKNDLAMFKENSTDFSDLITNGDFNILKQELKDCISEILPYFIHDYKFFFSNRLQDKREVYPKDLIVKYDKTTLVRSIVYLKTKYKEELDRVYDEAKKYRTKGAAKDRLEKSLDDKIEYIGKNNGILLCKTDLPMCLKKVVVKFDFKKNIAEFLAKFYTSNENMYTMVEGEYVFVTMKGTLLFGIKELYDYLETTFLGKILGKSKFKVIKYKKGSYLYLTCTSVCREVEVIVFNNMKFTFTLEKVPSKITLRKSVKEEL